MKTKLQKLGALVVLSTPALAMASDITNTVNTAIGDLKSDGVLFASGLIGVVIVIAAFHLGKRFLGGR